MEFSISTTGGDKAGTMVLGTSVFSGSAAIEKIEYYDKISSLESELKPDFFRIHKGYLVNIKYVERYDRTEVKMRNGDSLLISKYKYQDFVKRYLEYISEER